MRWFIDPRHGDIEDDWSSTKRRSLLSLAGSLAIEVSLFKLVLASLLLIVIPAVMLGLAPLVASAWVSKISASISDWIRECGGLLIASAPSPVMEATDNLRTYFYIQSATGVDGQLRLLRPQRIIMDGQPRPMAAEPQ